MGARFRLKTTCDGVELFDGSTEDEIWVVKCADIARILAWKEDCGTFDRIWLGLQAGGGRELSSCNEDTEGWDQLLNEIGTWYAIDENWWPKTAFPAFETNLTTVWSREPSDS